MLDLKWSASIIATLSTPEAYQELHPLRVFISQDARNPMQHWANSGYKLDLILPCLGALFLGFGWWKPSAVAPNYSTLDDLTVTSANLWFQNICVRNHEHNHELSWPLCTLRKILDIYIYLLCTPLKTNLYPKELMVGTWKFLLRMLPFQGTSCSFSGG